MNLADRFRIDRLIGTGGMAVVYEATDLALGRTVAVKLFRLDTGDIAGPERQSAEVTVLAGLNHFALVTLFDAGTTVIDGVHRPFIVMEFVDGTDLRSRIAAAPIPPAEVAAMGADLAEALHYVHAQGIVHRDIKPANVLLTPSGFPGRPVRAKLADFGIARLVDATRLTATGSVLGTAGYLSPEQALGTDIGPSSDVYSLGLVLLECLTRERAFPGTAVESAMARLQRDPVVPESLGAEWAAVLAGMTAREPAERLGSTDAAVRLRRLASADTGPGGAGDAGDAGENPWTPAAAGHSDAPTRVLPVGSRDEAATVAVAAAAPAPGAGAAASARPRPTRRMIAWLAGAAALLLVLVLALTLRPGAPAPALTPVPVASAVPTGPVSSSTPVSVVPIPTPSVDTKPGKGNGKSDPCKKKDDCGD